MLRRACWLLSCFAWLVSGFAGMAATGCAAHRTGDAVRSVHFEGNTRKGYGGLLAPQSDRALRNVMVQDPPRWQAFVLPGAIEPAWLDRSGLDADGKRIEVWYANHGFFDAKFLGWEVDASHVRPKRKVRPVDLVGYVDQGKPSYVTAVTVEGLESFRKGNGRALGSRLDAIVGVKTGEIFDEQVYRSTMSALTAHLRDNGYAYAKVSGSVEARPESHEVDVRISVEPGVLCTFGPHSFKGRAGVDTKLLEPLVTFDEGETYSGRKMSQTRSNLFGLRVFSVVNVVPDLSDPTRKVIPVTIELKAAPTHEVKAGPSVSIEPGKQELLGGVTYTDNNVAKRLWRWEVETETGIATLAETIPDIANLQPSTDLAPIVHFTTRFTMPRLAGNWTLVNEAAIELDAEPGYRILTPSYRPSVQYDGWEHLTPSLGYRIQYIDYFTSTFQTDLSADTTVSCDDQIFGDNVIDPGLLSVFEQSLTWDSRDDKMEPHNGWYWNLNLGEAGAGGNFAYLKAWGDVRSFKAIWDDLFDDLIVAGRLGGGVIQTLGNGDTARVPRPERFYLGGGTTVRGWPANKLGPLEDEDAACDESLAKGGKFMLYGNFELRKKVFGGLIAAGFLDAGRVWESIATFDAREIQYSVGAGVRYLTPIGPVRLDFAYVLNQDDYFVDSNPAKDPVAPDLAPWALHFGLSEAF